VWDIEGARVRERERENVEKCLQNTSL
jgi:hypothetical protein